MKNKVVEFDNSAAVDTYMAALSHPLKPVVEAIRRTILSSDGTITEGIKWNSPSFYCHGWFATINLRARDKLLVVLHRGAKPNETTTSSQAIDDAAHLLVWLSVDRATVTFIDAEDFQSKEAAFRAVVSQWAKYQVSITEYPIV